MRAASLLRPAVVLAVAFCAGGARAQDAIEPGCRAGTSPEACYREGLALADSALLPDARPQAVVEAVRVLLGACQRQVGDACYLAGRIIAADTGGSPHRSDTPLDGAARLFASGCYAEAPSAAACTALGASGTTRAGARDSALSHFERGCEMGNPTACVRAALLMDDWPPRLGARTYPGDLAERACEGGSPRGCVQAARRTAAALAREPAARRATPEFRRERDGVRARLRGACLQRLAPACTELGATWLPGDPVFRANRDSARFYLETACGGQGGAWAGDAPRPGDGAACARLGWLVLRDAGSDPDPAAAARAVEWFRRGCDLLDSGACAELAHHGTVHELIPMPLAQLRAVTACNEGSGAGCRVAGSLYTHPDVADISQYLQYLRRACRLDDGRGCAELGRAEIRPYLQLKHFRRACVLRDGSGCAAYGKLLAGINGPGTELPFLELACAYGHGPSCWTLVEAARARQDPVAEGELRSRACRADPAHCKRKLPLSL